MRIFLRLPNPRQNRKTFKIICDGRVLPDARITAINKSYSAGLIDFQVARDTGRKVVGELRNAARSPEYHEANWDIYGAVKKDYDGRSIGDKSRRNVLAGCRRVLSLLGSTSLLTITRNELKAIVLKQKPPARNKITVHLNLLLNAANRRDCLLEVVKHKPIVKYLTQKELFRVTQNLSDIEGMVAKVIFFTGCRLGEVFCLSDFFGKSSIKVEWQLRETSEIAQPKWGGVRVVTFQPAGKEVLRRWLRFLNSLTDSERLELRNRPWYEIIRQACEKTFPGKSAKHLTARDLRHCYGVYLLERGVKIHIVALNLGNTEKVVRDHYGGRVQTDDMESEILRLINRRRSA